MLLGGKDPGLAAPPLSFGGTPLWQGEGQLLCLAPETQGEERGCWG